MKESIARINSQKISEVVSNLCKQANICISKDVYNALFDSYLKEKSPKAKYSLWQILENLKLATTIERPICQDTGIVVVFLEIGQNILIEGDSIEDAINLGVQQAYEENFFRKSIVNDPVFERINTNTNTPAIIYPTFTTGNSIKITVSIKGCGCENMSAVQMLKPSAGPEGIVEFAVETLKSAGANTCPPVRLGIGIGGTMEYAAVLAKKALLEAVKTESDLERLIDSEPDSNNKKMLQMELDILQGINNLKIGANGLGGDITAFGINIKSYPTHIAALPVAININCHASRHARAEISDNDVKYYPENYESNFKNIENLENSSAKIDVDDIEALRKLQAGDMVFLNGYIYTARDAAHKKLFECINNNKELPIDIKDKIIYYTGPCPPVKGEIIGPAGPTTSIRMDKYTPVLMEKGLFGSIGKGARSEEVIESIKKNKGIYLATTGGAATLLGQKIIESEIVAYPELGTEAIYRFKVQDFPAIVAIDSNGNSILK